MARTLFQEPAEVTAAFALGGHSFCTPFKSSALSVSAVVVSGDGLFAIVCVPALFPDDRAVAGGDSSMVTRLQSRDVTRRKTLLAIDHR